MTGIVFATLTVLASIGLSIFIRKKWLNLRLGLILNTVLVTIGIGVMAFAFGSDLIPALCTVVLLVPTMDLALVMGLKYSLEHSDEQN